METLVLIIHVVLAVALIALILLQQGKGADAGASFGAGASQTVFGSKGSTSFLARLTAVIALILLVTSISLDIMTKHKAESVMNGGIPSSPAKTQKHVPASTSDVPQLQQKKPATSGKSDVPTLTTPAKTASSSESSTKHVSPSKAAPSKAVPSKATPSKTTSSKTAPSKTAPSKKSEDKK